MIRDIIKVVKLYASQSFCLFPARTLTLSLSAKSRCPSAPVFNLVPGTQHTGYTCNSHYSHAKWNIITSAVKGNSIHSSENEKRKKKGGVKKKRRREGMTGHRLLLSFERASTTLEFNAFVRQCRPLRPPGEITALNR
jgi:hypothetical protein